MGNDCRLRPKIKEEFNWFYRILTLMVHVLTQDHYYARLALSAVCMNVSFEHSIKCVLQLKMSSSLLVLFTDSYCLYAYICIFFLYIFVLIHIIYIHLSQSLQSHISCIMSDGGCEFGIMYQLCNIHKFKSIKCLCDKTVKDLLLYRRGQGTLSVKSDQSSSTFTTDSCLIVRFVVPDFKNNFQVYTKRLNGFFTASNIPRS